MFCRENIPFFQCVSVVLCMCTNSAVCYPGAIQPVCQQTHKKEALSGDDVLLSCHTEPRINLSMSTLDWKRPNLGPHPRHIVYVYRNQKDDPQSDQDTKRMSMNHKGLQWGNLSLLISQVRPSDSGPYESYIPGRGCVCAFQLNVGENAE